MNERGKIGKQYYTKIVNRNNPKRCLDVCRACRRYKTKRVLFFTKLHCCRSLDHDRIRMMVCHCDGYDHFRKKSFEDRMISDDCPYEMEHVVMKQDDK